MRMLKRIGPALLSGMLLLFAVAVSMSAARTEPLPPSAPESKAAEPAVQTQAEASVPESVPKTEMRAVWVPYMSLDMRNTDGSEDSFRKKFDKIVEVSKEKGMNALVVHVRPFGDSFYSSDYYPWSHVLTGTQGISPGYDPLRDMVEASHKAGLQLHAWINPLRIRTKGTPETLSQNNPYTVWKRDPKKSDWTVDWESGSYYNPAHEEVRKLIADGAAEIVKKYGVDGVQFDDYFYPTEDAAFDKKAYDGYCASLGGKNVPMSLSDWRKANINAMVSLVYRECKAENPKIVFGISPQGNIENDLKMGADVFSWCGAGGYVDYICPQLYVNFENPVLPFDKAVEEWKSMARKGSVSLYFGIGVYKAGSDADNGTWKKSSDILKRQIEYCREEKADGFMFYSWEYLEREETKEEVANAMKVLS